jgi:hypothetical protein
LQEQEDRRRMTDDSKNNRLKIGLCGRNSDIGLLAETSDKGFLNTQLAPPNTGLFHGQNCSIFWPVKKILFFVKKMIFFLDNSLFPNIEGFRTAKWFFVAAFFECEGNSVLVCKRRKV